MIGSYGDDARGLDARGRTRFREQAQRLKALVLLKGIFSSPLVRAVQTAEILAEALGLEEVVIADVLAPAANTARKMAALAEAQGAGYALVGHQPSVGEAAVLLSEGQTDSRFRKGAAMAFRPGTSGRPSPVWIADPDGELISC